jgi:hypothetical protein
MPSVSAIQPIPSFSKTTRLAFSSQATKTDPNLATELSPLEIEKKKLHQKGILNILGGVFDGFAMPGILTYLFMLKTGDITGTLPLVGGILALGAVIGKGVNSIIQGATQISKSR